MATIKIQHVYTSTENKDFSDGFIKKINTEDLLESESPKLLISLIGKDKLTEKITQAKKEGKSYLDIDMKLFVEISYFV